jgi:hypothetical protein
MYQMTRSGFSNIPSTTVKRLEDRLYISFDTANKEYIRFKQEINADQAQLQDADGNLMSASAAKAFVATLP